MLILLFLLPSQTFADSWTADLELQRPPSDDSQDLRYPVDQLGQLI